MFGMKTTFTCAGEDVIDIHWIIGDVPIYLLDDTLGQVEVHEELLEDDCLRSSLTIGGSAETDNISVTCVLLDISGLLPLPPVYLTVLGGESP